MTAVWEIELCLINDGGFYRTYTKPLILTQKKKHARGKFDYEVALRSFEKLVICGLKNYAANYCSSEVSWFKIISMEERKELAEKLLLYYMEQIMEDRS